MSKAPNRYTPEMRAFQVQLSGVVEQFMDERESAGASYPDAAADATAIMGEVVSAIIGALEHPSMRLAFIMSFSGNLPRAVEAKHAIARATMEHGSTVQ